MAGTPTVAEIEIGFTTSKPTSRTNKTGGWRVFRPVVDHTKCTRCGWCSVYCPEPCISVVDGKYVVDYDFCKGCAICAEECPVKCIEMVREV